MAVGDVVNAIGAPGRLTYRPAVGVEVLITSVWHHIGSAWEISLIDATPLQCYLSNANDNQNQLNTKIAITNTTWFTTMAGVYNAGFSGFQTK